MKKILVGDGDDFTRMLAERVLSNEYETVSASTGEEVLSLYESEKPDLVLMELHMPDMSGYDVLRRLLDKYNEDILLMFMASDETADNESRSFRSGAKDYIRKPFMPDVLLRRIENILQNDEKIKEVRRDADTDFMTGLLNRRSVQDEIERLCGREDSGGTLLMVDIDNFKLVNDIFGHEMGDQILITFGNIVRSSVRNSDIIGRMGGDEFIIFYNGTTDEKVIAAKCESIHSRLVEEARKLLGDKLAIPLGTSMGAAVLPDDGRDFMTLYQKADKALYSVKENGKHGHAFYKKKHSGAGVISDIPPADLDNTRMIFEERAAKPGAFGVGYENFMSIYRFLRRFSIRYDEDVQIMLFTLACNDSTISNDSDEFRDMSDSFWDYLIGSLRRSDVAARCGGDQYT